MKIIRLLSIGLAVFASVFLPGCTTTKGSPKKYSGATPLEWSERMARSEMARRGDALAWQTGKKVKWDYTAGLFTLSLLKLNAVTPDPQYVTFVTNAIGSFISNEGEIQTYRPAEYQLDALNPGKTVLALWRLTGEPRYKLAAEKLVKQLVTQPRTPDGGYWHKKIYTNQMWLDGIYMADPFHAEWAQLFGGTKDFDEVAEQIRLMDKNTYDRVSGLNFHGWDASKVQVWANPQTGCSSNFWGRAMGWYVMSLVDVLEYLPLNHPERTHILTTLDKTARGIVKWQDAETGVWWQVMDQAGRAGNYRESTASAMFVYALAKGVNRGWLTRDYVPAIERGYAGVIREFMRPDGAERWSLTRCCSVAGLCFKNSAGRDRDGTFDYYISEPIVDNDLKGVGPFILAGIEMQRLR